MIHGMAQKQPGVEPAQATDALALVLTDWSLAAMKSLGLSVPVGESLFGSGTPGVRSRGFLLADITTH